MTTSKKDTQTTPKAATVKVATNKEGLVTTKELAEAFGIAPKTLRKHLRAMKAYQDGGYTLYTWKPESRLLARTIEALQDRAMSSKEPLDMDEAALDAAFGKKGQ